MTSKQQRRPSTCHRHPTKPTTGLCAACLRERLSGIDPDTHHETSITHLSSELRRTRSLSSTSTSSNPNAASSSSSNTTTTTVANASTDPRRKSWDIRSQNTLSDLFVIDDKTRRRKTPKSLNLGSELKEEEDNVATQLKKNVCPQDVVHVDEDFEDGGGGDLKTMKEFIDLELERRRQHHKVKDFKVIAGTLWSAASVFSKKLGMSQRKQRMRKKNEVESGVSERKVRSEVGEYGLLGRRSCDIDSRLSFDVGRLSVDDSRYSFECEPGRVSWDGCLIGGRTYPKLMPLVSVIEDAKVGNEGVEDLQNEGEGIPGGTVQTREYYSDGRRRKSFDRSGLNKRAGMVDDEFKSMLNAKVSPEGVGLFHGAKLLVTEKELRDSNWYSLKDYRAESVDRITKDGGSVAGGKRAPKPNKPQRLRNLWNMWGFMQRKNRKKFGDEDHSIGANVANEEQNGTISQKLIRSYTVSARSSSVAGGGDETMEKCAKGREELMLQRNRSVRYSPNNLDNGLLRFYLTPSRSDYGRSKSARSSLSIARNDL